MDKELNREEAESAQTEPVQRWVVFLIISLALLMITIDSTIVATVLHTLKEDLGTSISWVGWTLTAYSFGFVLMLLLSAKLSTRFGHSRVFRLSVLIFSLASLFCGLSRNIYLLIVMRVIQAVGGAGITPSATGIIVSHFGSARAQFLGLFGSIFSIGAMIGPVFGGLIATYWPWSWIFFINLPLGLAVLLLSIRFLPKDNLSHTDHGRLDFTGLALMGMAILSVMFATTYLAEPGSTFSSPIFIGLTLLFLMSFLFLSRHLRNVKDPFIQPQFISGKGFGAVNLLNIIHLGMAIGANALVPLYAINRYGISEMGAGMLLVVNGVSSVILSVLMSIFINRTGYRKPLYIGGVIMIAGIALLSIEPLFGSPYVWMMISAFFIGVGIGTMSPAGRNAGISLAPDQSANIAAVRSLGMQLGQIVAIAGATAIIAGAKNTGYAQAIFYAGLATFLLITMPVISRITEQKGAW
ncbi:MAG: MFS transporter [Flavobacteriales bacterium]|nr:MFS transporter [Flavobacteriales bacterium]